MKNKFFFGLAYLLAGSMIYAQSTIGSSTGTFPTSDLNQLVGTNSSSSIVIPNVSTLNGWVYRSDGIDLASSTPYFESIHIFGSYLKSIIEGGINISNGAFVVDEISKFVGIGTTTPGSIFSIGSDSDDKGINFSLATTTFATLGGINISQGCFAINNICINTPTSTKSNLNVYSVSDFGAIGDGITNDTNSIISTIEHARIAGGGTVFFKPGVYSVNKTILVPSHVYLQGAGRDSTIIIPVKAQEFTDLTYQGTNVYTIIGFVGVTDVGVTDLTVDLKKNSLKKNGITLTSLNTGIPTTFARVERTRVIGFPTHEYLIWNYKGKNVTIRDNIVDGGCTYEQSEPLEGIEIYGGENVLVLDNYISNVCSNGIYIWEDELTNSGTEVNNIVVSGNIIKNGKLGITYVPFTSSKNILITNNTLDSQSQKGIFIASVGTSKIENVKVTNNIISSPVRSGLVVEGQGSRKWNSVTISNNNISQTTTSRNSLVEISNIGSLDFTNNSISDSLNTNLLQLSNASNVNILGNTFSNTTQWGIAIDYASYDISVSGNLFKNYGQNGVLVSGNSSRVQVINNLFSMPPGTSEKEAILANPGTTKVMMNGNSLSYVPTLKNPFLNNSLGGQTDIFAGKLGINIDAKYPVHIKQNAQGEGLFIEKLENTAGLKLYNDIGGQYIQATGGDLNILSNNGRIFYTANGTAFSLSHQFTSFNPMTYAGGLTRFIEALVTWKPNPGSGSFIAFLLSPTINQAVTSTGNYIGMKINLIELSAKGNPTKNYIAWFGKNNLPQLVLQAGGNVGIGNENPAYILDISGAIRVGSSTKPSGITLYDTATKLPYCLTIKNGIAVPTGGECTK